MNTSLLRRVINIIVSFFTGGVLVFSGFLAFMPLKYIDDFLLNTIFSGSGENTRYILLLVIVSGGMIGIFSETVRTSNRALLFFRDSIKRKSLLLLAVILCVAGSLFIKLAIKFKYITLGKQITEMVAKSVKRGVYDVSVDIPGSIKYLIVTGEYSLSEDEILRTGIIGKNLAKDIASEYANTEGTYLYLVGARRCLTMVSFPPEFYINERFLLTCASDKATIYLRREFVKDKFGKNFEQFLIYKVE